MVRMKSLASLGLVAISLAGCSSPFVDRASSPGIPYVAEKSAQRTLAPGDGAGTRVPARLYAGGPIRNAVDVYPAFANNPKPVGEIVNGLSAPTGIAVDAAGNVYVCNNAGHSGKDKTNVWTVTVYKRGQTVPFRTYSDGVWSPVDVAVAPDGTVYIANYSSAVTVYPPNSVHPSRTLVAPSLQAPVGIALDATGDVFVSYVNQGSGGVVYKYAPGKDTGSNLGIVFAGNPHGLAVDRAGNLVVAVSNAPSPGSLIEVFAPGSTQLKMTMSGPFQPFMLAFSRNGARLFAADFGSGNDDGGVFEYAYPAGTLINKDTQGAGASAYGVAIDPVAAP
jgi:sugar lactone lactonase YvrE